MSILNSTRIYLLCLRITFYKSFKIAAMLLMTIRHTHMKVINRCIQYTQKMAENVRQTVEWCKKPNQEERTKQKRRTEDQTNRQKGHKKVQKPHYIIR